METKVLINYSTVRYKKHLLHVFIKLCLLLLSAWLLFYLLSTPARRNYFESNPLLAVSISFVFIAIALIQTWVNARIYIYSVFTRDGQITLKWQDRNLLKGKTLPIESITAKIKPSGKNTPYVEVTLITEQGKAILNQTGFPGWDKKEMKKFVMELNEIKKGNVPGK